MKRLVLVLVTIYLLQSASGITDELRKKATETRLKCKQQVGLSDKEYQDWVKGISLPITNGGSCCEVCACWMRELGYMTDGHLNLNNMKNVNTQKWSEKANVEKANQIDTLCTARVVQDGRKECEIALDYRKCKTEMIKQNGGPPKPGST
uniref:Odorant-binding protein 16b n=1 Tax=Lygus lineolaris TaxID=50650 RepID=W0HHU2_LYGLI|nr:odorant-binding protein 16b [Lygus lineolaris]